MNPAEPSEQVLMSLRRIIRAIELHSRHLVQEYGLTGPQLVILREVADRGEVTAGDLARSTSLSQATVTGIVTRLEKRQLVYREKGDADKRKVWVKATPQCHELLNNAPPLLQTSFVDAFRKLKDWEQTLILSSMQRLVDLMEAGDVDASSMLMVGPMDDHTRERPEDAMLL